MDFGVEYELVDGLSWNCIPRDELTLDKIIKTSSQLGRRYFFVKIGERAGCFGRIGYFVLFLFLHFYNPLL